MRKQITRLLRGGGDVGVLVGPWSGLQGQTTCYKGSTEAMSKPGRVRFWRSSLIYIDEYLTGARERAASARIRPRPLYRHYQSATGKQQSECIMRYRGHGTAGKASKGPSSRTGEGEKLFRLRKRLSCCALTLPAQVKQLSRRRNGCKVSADDYYAKMGWRNSERQAMELNEKFVAVTARTIPSRTGKGITASTVCRSCASVGWLPLRGESGCGQRSFPPVATSMRGDGQSGKPAHQGGFDGEKVGAEIGMTVQLLQTPYPSTITIRRKSTDRTRRSVSSQNKVMVMQTGIGDQLWQDRKEKGWQVAIEGSQGKWQKWFANQEQDKRMADLIEVTPSSF
ncbi:hypothetical protein [Candidatus Accumulibacter sp. ACC012]|uniref:hypothetical protein n=1 Tax=Candidatus Accumulibacter sp. ACC012 TaxID=2823332 RepID=UPI0025BA205B|nr:hypothetical protein [Candidatus Accumulibacter sp. ACC012]